LEVTVNVILYYSKDSLLIFPHLLRESAEFLTQIYKAKYSREKIAEHNTTKHKKIHPQLSHFAHLKQGTCAGLTIFFFFFGETRKVCSSDFQNVSCVKEEAARATPVTPCGLSVTDNLGRA
jgi:hypothetical protein